MSFRRFLAPFLGTVILAITAMLGVGVASAHPGHAHSVANGAAAPVQISRAFEKAAVPAPSATTGAEAIFEADAAAPMSFDIAVSEAPARDLPGAGCVGMCCDNTPCGGCVKMAFAKASLPVPPLCAWSPAAIDARKLTGRLAESPNKPPRAFI